MAESPSFRRLWSWRKFTERVAGIFVDEAHCIHEWGDEFRPVYQELVTLRVYAGYEVHIIAYSATLPTETFNVVWDKLDYGHRPFFGVDTGTDRPNLLFLVRPVEYPDDPARDVINMLPGRLTGTSTADDLKFEVIFYIQNETACRKAKDTIRRCLPSHRRNLVYNFWSSEGAPPPDQGHTCEPSERHGGGTGGANPSSLKEGKNVSFKRNYFDPCR